MPLSLSSGFMRPQATRKPLYALTLAFAGVMLLGPVGAVGAQKKAVPHAASKAAAPGAAKQSAVHKTVGRTAAKQELARPQAGRDLKKSTQAKAVAASVVPPVGRHNHQREAAAAVRAGKRLAGKHAADQQVAVKQPARRRSAIKQAAGKNAAGNAAASKSIAAVTYSLRQSAPMRGLTQQMPRAQQRAEWEEPPVPHLSFGELAGLRDTPDALDLKSSVALVVDQDTNQVLLRKNDSAVLPIASLTKLMTGLVMSEAQLPLDEMITIDQDDVDTEKHSRSRLRVGTTLSRGELLHLALMSSENRAAHALGRTFPGGISRFVNLMNARATMLGMRDTRYVEPTGLSSANQSSAVDLATLVGAAYNNALVREMSTSPSYELEVGDRLIQFNNTNRLVNSPQWDIGLQKTGYIAEAGQCLVMQARIAGRKLIMVFLDSAGKLSRIGDAERVRRWIENTHPVFPALHRAVPAING